MSGRQDEKQPRSSGARGMRAPAQREEREVKSCGRSVQVISTGASAGGDRERETARAQLECTFVMKNGYRDERRPKQGDSASAEHVEP